MQDRASRLQHDMIAALYASAAGLALPSRPLELLAEMTRSDKAFAANFNLDERRGAICASFNVEPNFVETYGELYASQNPWLARAPYFQAEGLVWRGAEIVEPARLKETEFYKLFLYGQAIGPTVHLVIRVRGPEVYHVMLTRRTNTDDYDADALEFCRLYTTHARQAFDISDAGATRRFVQDGTDAAFDELAAGVAIVEPPATILHMNTTFATLALGASATGRSAPGALPKFSRFSKPHVDARLPRQLAEALAARPVPSFCNIESGADDDARPTSVGIRPIRLAGAAGGNSRSGFVLIARTAASPFELDEAPLRAAYMLTAAEARVCAGLISGDNVHVLSQRLGISPQTARTHLKRIYDKTGTTRQAELLRLLITFAYRKRPARQVEPEQRPVLASNVLPLRFSRGIERSE